MTPEETLEWFKNQERLQHELIAQLLSNLPSTPSDHCKALKQAKAYHEKALHDVERMLRESNCP